ncbi:MAG: flagellar protein FlaG [Shewanella sp.]|jgi:flagellar protein FlaG
MTMDVNIASFASATKPTITPAANSVSANSSAEQSKALKSETTLDAAKVVEIDQTHQAKEDEQSKVEELDALAADLTDMMSLMRKGLAFKVDDDSGQNVVSVMDVDSGELIRQIPNEEALELAQKLAEVAGFLLKTEA